ncbi:hypothetical protein BGZ72_005432 [Mortierella alpina]|nr:hypothetical protein BGZ72_005432 [Mortierella alpina]
MSQTRHRSILSNAQRLQMCAYSKSNPDLSGPALSVWAEREFKLKRPLTLRVVYKTLRSAPELQALDRNDLHLKRMPKVKPPKMDLALGLWATQFGRLRGRAPTFGEYQAQVRVFKQLGKPTTHITNGLQFVAFLRRYGLFGPVASWNFRGSVRAILDVTGDRKLSDNEMLTFAGIGPDAAANTKGIDSDTSDGLNGIGNGDDDDDDIIDSDIDSDYSISRNDDNTNSSKNNSNSNSGERVGDEESLAPSAASAASAVPAAPQPPQPQNASGAAAAPQAPTVPTVSQAPAAPPPEALASRKTSWPGKDVITILDDSDVDEPMDQVENNANSVQHGMGDEHVLRTTATEDANTKSASGYRSLVVVLDLLEQYMATQDLVHMVLEEMKEKKEQELKKNTTSSNAPSAPLSSGDGGSLEETLSSITAVMDDLDESQPMERATRLILRHMHYHLTCTATP